MLTLMRNGKSLSAVAILSLLAILLVAVAPFDAAAQSESASVSGRVTDQQNAIVPDVEVELRNADTGVSQLTKTNSDGFYTFSYVKPGNYVMNVRKQQFQTVSVTGITLNVQDNLSRNFVLQIGSSSVSITVTADQNNINTTDASVGTVIDRQFVANLPLNGRSFNTLLQLTPGVVQGPAGFNVSGQRDDANYYTVDGVSANFGVSLRGTSGQGPAVTSFGGTNSLLSIDALQEFRIQTSSSGAESGRMPGGQVEVTTRSGTNNLHGDVFNYFRNDAMDANDWFYDQALGTAPPGSLPRPALRQNDFGATLGGKIIRDRLFFFASYEGLRLVQPGVQQWFVPNAQTRASIPTPLNQLANAFPLPNGPDQGNGWAAFTQTASARQNLDVGSIRIDYAVAPRLSLFGRTSFAASSSQSPSLNQISIADLPTRFVTIGLNQQLSSHLDHQLRFNYSISKVTNRFALDSLSGAVVPDMSLLVPAPYTSSGGAFFFLSSNDFANFAFYSVGPGLAISSDQYNVVENLSWSVGRHVLKFGGDYRRANFGINNTRIVFDYFPLVSDLDSGGTSGGGTSLNEPIRYEANNTSLYMQDTWRAGPKVVLTSGLRWDVNTGPTANNGREFLIAQNVSNPADLAASPGHQLWKTTLTNFAPRLGVVVNPSSSNRIVLRSGFGMFYDLGTNNSGTMLANYPFFSGNSFPGFLALPLANPAQYVPTFTLSPPYTGGLVYLTDPNLKLPYSFQWNVGTSVSLSQSDVLNFTYVGQAGRRLLLEQQPTTNANFRTVRITQNGSVSNYDAFQAQYIHRVTHNLQALANYTYSHSLDDLSSNSGGNFPIAELPATNQYGNSDFDVRHNFSAAVTYDFRRAFASRPLAALLNGWGADNILYARTGLPITVQEGNPSQSILLGVSRPDVVPGQNFWVTTPGAPGGQEINANAFSPRPASRQGTLTRNAVPGFGFTQWDTSLRRSFALAENWKLLLRVDLFNALNHPNFANPAPFFNCTSGPNPQCSVTSRQSPKMLNQSLAGLSSIYQNGGPRSLQVSLKLQF